MQEPIKSGDLCHIVEGALGKKGPNIGKVVTVTAFRGEHSKHGRIWQVTGSSLVTEYGAVALAVCAQSWLKKIEPPNLPLKQREKELVD